MTTDVRIRVTRIVDDDELARQIQPKMEALGEAIGARAQRLVPKRSWSLHDSIAATTERRGSRVTTIVGAGGGDVDYALEVERGTSKMRAQPYLRPAFAQTTGRDLAYAGKGITKHGVVSFTSRRARTRARGKR